MTEYEKVLNDYMECDAEYLHPKTQEVFVKLVERATPKKAIKVKGVQGIYYECPVCGNQVIQNHCCDNNECRQALDWIE